jgi:hypothetical protein
MTVKWVKSRGFMLLESTFGIAILAVFIASMGGMLPSLNTAIKSYDNGAWINHRLIKQRLDTQLSQYHKFADAM